MFGQRFHENNIGDPIREKVYLVLNRDFTYQGQVRHHVEFVSQTGVLFVWMTNGGVRYDALKQEFQEGTLLFLNATIKDFREYQGNLETWVKNCRFERLTETCPQNAEAKNRPSPGH